MSAAFPVFYDRVEIYSNALAYLPNGMIRNFTMSATFNSSINQGFSPTGLGSGVTYGNKTISNVGWTEYLQDLNNYLNFSTFLLANPNTIITVVPVSLASGVPNAPQFTISGIVLRSIDISTPEEGSPGIRSCSFMAVDSSNT